MFLRWLRRRKLRRLLRFYGIEKDDDDIEIERIGWAKIGGLICIYRAITPDLLVEAQMNLSLYATENDRKQHELKARLAEKNKDAAEEAYTRFAASMADVFEVALLKPDPSKHDMRTLAKNPLLGPELYGTILGHSTKKKL